MKAKILAVTTTCNDEAKLTELAHQLLEQHCAACCQIEGPITSHYRWNGKIESASEYRCLIKTTSTNYAEVEQTILQMHPYDQPQITAIELSQVETGFADWVREECRCDAT